MIARDVLRQIGFALRRRRRNFDPRRPLLFMHVPKTAGTAFTAGLQDALQPEAVVGGLDASTFGTFQDFASISDPVRRQVHLPPDGLPRGAQLVSGHFACSSLRHAYGPGQLMTLLREPVCRLLSLWLFWRQHDDAMLAPWGRWADHVRLSRQPLARFLRSPLIACQTDNVVLRLLLWPHLLIPAGGFIDPAHDAILLRDAKARLSRFAFADAIENPGLSRRLETWLGRPMVAGRINETSDMPDSLRRPLDSELTQEALDLLESRSRLDLELWRTLIRGSMPGADIVALRESTQSRAIARYATLMAPRSPVLATAHG